MSSPSTAQLEANRGNAQHSTGPKSEPGKRRSSLNATRHGLTGRTVVLPGEDMVVYQAFAKEIVNSLHPETPLERQFAQTVADTQWRLNRARTIEDGMLAWGNFEPEGNFTADRPEIHAALTAARVFRERHQAFANLALYEQRLQRAQKEALRQLRELQAERKATRPAPPLSRQAKPVVSGFVYSNREFTPNPPVNSPDSNPEQTQFPPRITQNQAA